jgi:3-phenylpropionate/cinnamic acid dioxygenase small subunit
MSVAVAVDLETRLAINDLLVHEAELLDDRRFEEWLELFTPDVEYLAPIRVSRKNPAPDTNEDIFFYDENLQSLTLRVRRLATDVAWAEDPPSLTRHFVTNIRVRPAEAQGELQVRSNVLLFRSRGDLGAHDLLSAERTDLMRLVDGAWRIARRRIVFDQASLGTKNLGVFL